MTAVWIGNQNGAPQATTTNYFPLGDTGPATAISSLNEADAEVTCRVAGTLDKFYVYTRANGRSTNSTFASRKNTAAGNLSVSVLAGVTGIVSDLVNSDTLADGDRFCLQRVCTTPAAALNCHVTARLTPSSGTGRQLIGRGGGNFNTASATRYVSFGGTLVSTLTVTTDADSYALVAGTLSRLMTNLNSNARATATTLKSIKNGADGAQSVSCTGSTTGLFEDTTHSDSLSVGDTFCAAFVTGSGSGSFSGVGWVAAKFVSSSDDMINIHQGSAAQSPTSTNPADRSLFGDLQAVAAAVDTYQCPVPHDLTLKGLAVYVTANSGGATVTYSSMVNDDPAHAAVAGNLSVSIGAAATGWFTDVSHTDILPAGYLAFFRMSTVASGAVSTRGHTVLSTPTVSSFTWFPMSNDVPRFPPTEMIGY